MVTRGIVLAREGSQFWIRTDQGDVTATLRGRVKRHEDRALPGDQVTLESSGAEWAIASVEPRRNVLARREPGNRLRERTAIDDVAVRQDEVAARRACRRQSGPDADLRTINVPVGITNVRQAVAVGDGPVVGLNRAEFCLRVDAAPILKATIRDRQDRVLRLSTVGRTQSRKCRSRETDDRLRDLQHEILQGKKPSIARYVAGHSRNDRTTATGRSV